MSKWFDKEKFDKYLDRSVLISHIINVICSGINFIDVFAIVGFVVEKVWHMIRGKSNS